MPKTLTPRTIDLDALVLQKGSHDPDSTFCVMEAVAYIAGEPWSDHPKCACPVIAAFLRRWNDDLDDTDRQLLKPYIPKLVGTRGTSRVQEKRVWMLVDWLIRVYTPAWLELSGLNKQATALRSLLVITDPESLAATLQPLKNAQTKGSAARAAAVDAAGSAARAAAVDAAGSAAWAAAVDAARDAAWDALKPTKLSLQQSALALLDSLIACKE